MIQLKYGNYICHPHSSRDYSGHFMKGRGPLNEMETNNSTKSTFWKNWGQKYSDLLILTFLINTSNTNLLLLYQAYIEYASPYV